MRVGGTTCATGRTVGLNGFGAFTGSGFDRRRWVSVVGKALIRVRPVTSGRLGSSKPYRISTYCLKPRNCITLALVQTVFSMINYAT
jgi:hypothetical protein